MSIRNNNRFELAIYINNDLLITFEHLATQTSIHNDKGNNLVILDTEGYMGRVNHILIDEPFTGFTVQTSSKTYSVSIRLFEVR